MMERSVIRRWNNRSPHLSASFLVLSVQSDYYVYTSEESNLEFAVDDRHSLLCVLLSLREASRWLDSCNDERRRRYLKHSECSLWILSGVIRRAANHHRVRDLVPQHRLP